MSDQLFTCPFCARDVIVPGLSQTQLQPLVDALREIKQLLEEKVHPTITECSIYDLACAAFASFAPDKEGD